MGQVTAEERQSPEYLKLLTSYNEVYNGTMAEENLTLLINQLVTDFAKDKQAFIKNVRYLTDITLQKDANDLGRTGGNKILLTEFIQAFMAVYDSDAINEFFKSANTKLSELTLSEETCFLFAAINDALPDAIPIEDEIAQAKAKKAIKASKANAGSRLAVKTVNPLFLPDIPREILYAKNVEDMPGISKSDAKKFTKQCEKGIESFFDSFESKSHAAELNKLRRDLQGKTPLEQYKILVAAYDRANKEGSGKYISHIRFAIHHLAVKGPLVTQAAIRVQKLSTQPHEGRLEADSWFSANAERGKVTYETALASQPQAAEGAKSRARRSLSERLQAEKLPRAVVANAARVIIQLQTKGREESDFNEDFTEKYVKAVKVIVDECIATERHPPRNFEKVATQVLEQISQPANDSEMNRDASSGLSSK